MATTRGGRDAGGQSSTAFDAPLRALCEAAALAADDQFARANGVFLSRAHGPLHDLAAAVDEDDRRLSARLLEAKASVESTLPLGDAAAAPALNNLVAVAREATAAVTRSEPAPCEDP